MQSEAQKRADAAQAKRWEEKGVVKITLRIHESDRQKFLVNAKKSRLKAER